jgi:hypothetical protein
MSLSLFKIENLGFEHKVLNSNQGYLNSNQGDFKMKNKNFEIPFLFWFQTQI